MESLQKSGHVGKNGAEPSLDSSVSSSHLCFNYRAALSCPDLTQADLINDEFSGNRARTGTFGSTVFDASDLTTRTGTKHRMRQYNPQLTPDMQWSAVDNQKFKPWRLRPFTLLHYSKSVSESPAMLPSNQPQGMASSDHPSSQPSGLPSNQWLDQKNPRLGLHIHRITPRSNPRMSTHRSIIRLQHALNLKLSALTMSLPY